MDLKRKPLLFKSNVKIKGAAIDWVKILSFRSMVSWSAILWNIQMRCEWQKRATHSNIFGEDSEKWNRAQVKKAFGGHNFSAVAFLFEVQQTSMSRSTDNQKYGGLKRPSTTISSKKLIFLLYSTRFLPPTTLYHHMTEAQTFSSCSSFCVSIQL